MSNNINYSNFSLNGLSRPSNLNPTAQFIWDSNISPSGAFRPLKTSDTGGGGGSASATNNSGPRTSGNALDSNVSRKSLLIYPNTANPIYVQDQNARQNGQETSFVKKLLYFKFKYSGYFKDSFLFFFLYNLKLFNGK